MARLEITQQTSIAGLTIAGAATRTADAAAIAQATIPHGLTGSLGAVVSSNPSTDELVVSGTSGFDVDDPVDVYDLTTGKVWRNAYLITDSTNDTYQYGETDAELPTAGNAVQIKAIQQVNLAFTIADLAGLIVHATDRCAVTFLSGTSWPGNRRHSVAVPAGGGLVWIDRGLVIPWGGGATVDRLYASNPNAADLTLSVIALYNT